MKPSPFSETYAHPGDLLPVHLERVAQRAAESIALIAQLEIRQIAFLAGLFHDIGKATPYFQTYLLKPPHRKTKLTPHAKSGAVLSWWFTGELGFPLWIRLSVFIAVLRHHGGLNFESWSQPLKNTRYDLQQEGDPLLIQLNSLDLAGIQAWLIEVTKRNPEIFERPLSGLSLTLESIINRLQDRRAAGRLQLRLAFQNLNEGLMFLAGFGGLLAMDKLDAALQGGAVPRQSLPKEAVNVFMAQQQHTASALNERRSRIASEVLQSWLNHLPEPLLTLTAPTGSGKTLAILNAALAVRQAIQREQGYAPRLIYCLPFTSVIDQNHEVFRAVLKANGIGDQEDILLKHHHLVEGVFRTGETEHAPDGAGQLLTETWQSEIVVTTFHQLLYTLLSNQNSNLKRAGQLTGSLVLMDEVQALPLRYWEGLRRLFQASAQTLGARFILLTATKPLIFRPEDAQELLPSHTEHFQALARVQLYCHQQTPISLESFAKHLINMLDTASQATLIILNRRKAVRSVFLQLAKAFPRRKLIALSTDLTPRDRRTRIRLIQRLLRRGENCIVVSTQLVEAGVDVSFPIVHRDLAPLDAIIQSAGRCNRHAARNKPGEVHLWNIHEDKADGLGKPLWQRIYDSPLIQVTERILAEQIVWTESDFLDLSQRYFENCWQTMDQERMDEWLTAGNFTQLSQSLQLIPDGLPKAAVFVAASPCDERLWQHYQAIQNNQDLSPLQRGQRFRKIRAAFYERIVQIYAPPDPNQPIGYLELGSDCYSRETGFIAPAEDDTACIL
jgi:CRISPR-associated endonuclease/helicase Cas3